MGTWIALLRGVNVGGKHRLVMKDWARDLTALQFANVQTYIQSGNAIFQSARRSAGELARDIATDLERRYDYRIDVMVLLARQLTQIIANNPFPEAAQAPTSLHVYLLGCRPTDPDLAALTKNKAPDEQFRLAATTFYLFAPSGIGRSRLAARVERALGVATTARNWNTICNLAEMADAI